MHGLARPSGSRVQHSRFSRRHQAQNPQEGKIRKKAKSARRQKPQEGKSCKKLVKFLKVLRSISYFLWKRLFWSSCYHPQARVCPEQARVCHPQARVFAPLRKCRRLRMLGCGIATTT